MKTLNKIHCFFEQSGTFKNEFKKFGYVAEDYDILNQFNQTDHVIDLFEQIEKAYDGKESIFDNINSNDLIIAFFPCVRFEDQIIMHFRSDARGTKDRSIQSKMEQDIKLHTELHHLYCLISKLVIVCDKRKIPLIIENPYSSQHYLTRYWALKPKLIDTDRRDMGDFYEKPTQFWFINCEPKFNFIFEGVDRKPTKRVIDANTVERSMISPDYANRFIREFVIDEILERNDI